MSEMLQITDAEDASRVLSEHNGKWVPSRRGRYGHPTYMVPKRIIDFTLSLTALILLFPVFAFIAIVLALKDGFPVVFRHERVGYKGKHIQIYKFRTMVKNADEVLKANPALYEEFQKNFKLEHDPRITKFGHFLRKSTLDELPQLVNVLKGDMALVGPRPIVPAEIEKYGDAQDVYLSMIPGCAGLWQCNGRSDTSYKERIELDREYSQHASLRTDASILIRTIFSVFLGRGAK
ncbi:MAG: sugar transferase [Armatimonadetes bacterium]|nr:sugar transferase [Armatimonadota bacterium]